jgi:hypothetical protein
VNSDVSSQKPWWHWTRWAELSAKVQAGEALLGVEAAILHTLDGGELTPAEVARLYDTWDDAERTQFKWLVRERRTVDSMLEGCHEMAELLSTPEAFVVALLALTLSALWSAAKVLSLASPLALWVWYHGRLLVAGPKYKPGGGRTKPGTKNPPPTHMWPGGKEPVFPHGLTLNSESNKAKSKKLIETTQKRRFPL